MTWGSERGGLDHEVAKPPLWLLGASAACGALGVLSALVTRTIPVNIAGWFVAVMGLVLVGVFLVKNARLHTGLVLSSEWTAPLKVIAFALSLAAVVGNAWRIADVVARW